MVSAKQNNLSQVLSESTQKTVQAFDGLGTDDKLALLYYIYKKMGDSITPAAPTAADPELAPTLLGDFYDMSDDEQLAAMRAIANGEETELSRAYGGLRPNNQLVVWYAWAKGMGDTVVDLPSDYKATKAVKEALSHIENLEFEEQISVLRQVASNMGYSEVGSVPSQEETGKTPSL
ncbi:orange carotenoid protein N-terminal domain-containing protein [Lyngbya aestuarii]|uniref:orange carotenoid protein N-terminal domain-containing protein n=1 Tax=Lyngbya aestuarii TaxID=118322 RepID=UPI00403DA9B4